MSAKIEIQITVSISRDLLRPTEFLAAFPAPTDPKDEVAKTLHVRAVEATMSAQAIATKHCELMGMQLGIGVGSPLVFSTKLDSVATVEQRAKEIEQWMRETMDVAKELYKKRPAFVYDYLQAEMPNASDQKFADAPVAGENG